MSYTILLVAHIAVLGYWLGSELVINSEYRFVCMRDDLDFAARDAVMAHVMDADQHVRYALILQLALGAMLVAVTGLGPSWLLMAAPFAGATWLALVEIVHHQRETTLGQRLAAFDRWLRYIVMAALLALAAVAALPFWLKLKLAAFAGVMACGVGIRFALIAHFRRWAAMRADGPDAIANAAIKAIYWRATGVLGLLWLFIAAVVILSILKP